MADAVIDEHARLQYSRRRGRDGSGGGPSGRRRARGVLVDDEVVRGGSHRSVRVAAEASEGWSEAGTEAVEESSGEHLSLSLGRRGEVEVLHRSWYPFSSLASGSYSFHFFFSSSFLLFFSLTVAWGASWLGE